MPAEPITLTAPTTGERLDKLLVAHFPDYSRAQWQEQISAGQVLVNGKPAKAGNKLKAGDAVTVMPPESDEPEPLIEPQDIPLTVLYEDEDIAVIDKPAGMVVHPGVAQESGTLVHALLARYPQLVDLQHDPLAEGRMGIVHRLDKDTSGLLVTALHKDALLHLMAQFQRRTVDKAYLALLERTPKTVTGTINAAIGRDPRQRKRMGVRSDGKEAITEFEVLDTAFRDGRALVRLRILTGRTHQIRVHMAFIGCPVVGDTVYGYRKQRVGLKRNFLHAAQLSFEHPRTGERKQFSSALPVSLQNVMDKLREG